MALISFLKPKNKLEEGGRTAAIVQGDEGEPEKKCPNCHREIPLSRLWADNQVCSCGYHFRMKARQRIRMIVDKHSFSELYSGLKSDNPLDFPGYRDNALLKQDSRALYLCHSSAMLCRVLRPVLRMGGV